MAEYARLATPDTNFGKRPGDVLGEHPVQSEPHRRVAEVVVGGGNRLVDHWVEGGVAHLAKAHERSEQPAASRGNRRLDLAVGKLEASAPSRIAPHPAHASGSRSQAADSPAIRSARC